MDTLVIRFSSLGDIVLAGAVTGGLGPVTFLTHARYAELAARLPGVRRVLRHGEDPLPRGFDRVVDLHASPRSRLLARRLGGPVRRVRRHDLARRARVAFKRPPAPPVVRRYAEAAGVVPAPCPWLPRPAPGDALLLVPGAAHAAKRWPAARWSELARDWAGPVRLLGSAAERPLLDRVAAPLGSRAEVVAERGFARTFAALDGARAAVAGDTGLAHLAAASGVPTAVIFGPTTAEDGFWEGRCVPVGLPLPCRPCSRHGRDRCPAGDHLCLEGLPVAAVAAALRRALERPPCGG